MKNNQLEKLSDYADYSKAKISIAEIDTKCYFSTENMLPNKGGVTEAAGLPTQDNVTKVLPENVLVSNIRPYFKKIYFANELAGASNDVLCFVAKNGCLPRYLYYLLSSDSFFDYMMAGAKGTKMPRGDKGQIMNFPVWVPAQNEQSRIVSVLSALDEKIENISKINHNLEQQAQVLFERLLCSGNGETTLDSIALINPPRSLKKGCLARCIDMAQLSTSQSFPQLGTIKPYSGGMKFKNGDTIFARITPCLENGKTAYIDFLKEDEVAFGSTEYIVMSSRGGMPSPFFYCLARYKDFIEYATKRMNGSSGRQRVSADAIAAFPIPFFSGDAMCEFGKTALPVFNVIKNNSIENLRLAALRDTLLPRLMSGEIDVSEVEV